MIDFPKVYHIDIEHNINELYFLTQFTINDYKNTAYIECNDGESFGFAILKRDGWFLHKEDGPAYVDIQQSRNRGTKLFFHEGINYRIEDLPIDNEIILVLMLKYEYINTCYNKGYHWYD